MTWKWWIHQRAMRFAMTRTTLASGDEERKKRTDL